MKPFYELNDPIVSSTSFQNSIFKDRIGQIYYVFDWENDRIFDWCYDAHQMVNYNAVRVGDKYLTCGSDSYAYVCSKSGKIAWSSLSFYSYLDAWETSSNYGLLEYIAFDSEKNLDQYYFYIFNSEKGSVDLKKSVLVEYDSCSDVFLIKSDDKGNFWTINPKEDYYYITKIDPVSRTATDFRTENEYRLYDEEKQKSLYFRAEMLSVYDDYILFKYRNPKRGINKIYFYKITSEGAKVMHELDITNVPVNEVVVVNESVYVVGLKNKLTRIHKINFSEDLENMNLEFLAEIKINYTDYVYKRGNRLYFTDSWDTNYFKYAWYDTVTGEIGDQKVIDILGMCRS